MRSSAPYTRATLRGIRRGRGPNSTSVPPSRAVNTNAERLRLRRQPSPQPADIPADIPSASRTKTSKEEKVDIVKDLLRQWGWSFHRLVFEYLESENGHRGNRKKKKVGDLLVPLLEDKEVQEELVDRADIHTTLITCTIRCIRKELRQLQLQRGPFNTWTPDIEFQDVDLENTAKFVQQHGPLLFRLIEGISAPNREERSRDPHGGRAVIVTSIFLLGFARNSANGFARLLGLHLQALGVKRRVLSFLHGLGLIDGYKTLNAKKLGLAERSKEGPINSAGLSSANNPQETD
jgi:hypothetical protein